MKQVDQKQFTKTTGVSDLGSPVLHENLEFYVGDAAACVLVRDRVDDDYSFVIFAARKGEKFETVETAVSIPTIEEARAAMLERAQKRGAN